MTATELIDVVDAADCIRFPCARAEVHRLQLRHRAVHVLVFDAVGRVFLQQRSFSKDVAPGLWDTSAAGHVDSGESYDSAAVRELEEELGLAGVTLERLFKLPAGADSGWEFVWVYRTTADKDLSLNPAEIAAGEWLSQAELDSQLAAEPARFTITLRLLWQRLRTADQGCRDASIFAPGRALPSENP